jgi:tetratricopeptide (TPR) repeat protein
VYFLLGDYPKALADVEAALQLNPKSADFFYRRAMAREAQDEATAAASDFADARKLVKNDAEWATIETEMIGLRKKAVSGSKTPARIWASASCRLRA